MTDVNEQNKAVMEEFRANAGKVGGYFEGVPMVIVTTTGAKTGKTRENPLVYLPDGDRMIIFAAKAGMPDNPDWYYNLVKNPDVGVEVGTETFRATATVIESDERDRLYAKQAELSPSFAEYEHKTTRRIPVVALERVSH